jgi:hypothetical protein
VDIPGGDMTEGNSLWLWDCLDDAEGQKWGYNETTKQFYVQHHEALCMGVDSTIRDENKTLQLTSCLDSHETWSMAKIWEPTMPTTTKPPELPAPPLPPTSNAIQIVKGERKSHGSVSEWCLAVPFGQYTRGTELYGRRCHSTIDPNDYETERWLFNETTGTINWYPDPSKCLEIKGAHMTEGSTLWLWDCMDGFEAQKWAYNETSQQIHVQQEQELCIAMAHDDWQSSSRELALASCREPSNFHGWHMRKIVPPTALPHFV